MNTNHLAVALVAVVVSAGALAQSAPASSVTRAQVRMELAQARADGTLPLSEANFLPYQFATAPTRVTTADAQRTVAIAPAPRQASAAEPIRETRR